MKKELTITDVVLISLIAIIAISGEPFLALIVGILSLILITLITEDEKVDIPLNDNHKYSLFMKNKAEYLKSRQWSNKRQEVLNRDKYRCRSCGAYANLQIHHLSHYACIPNEPTSALVALCGTCHTKFHEKYGYPKTYNDYMKWDFSIDTVKNLK